MAFLLETAFNGSALVQDANNHPNLRMMTTRKTTAGSPVRDLIGPLPLPWAVSSNVSVSDDGKYLRSGAGSEDDNWLYMSAVCYLFGLNIHRARGYPVGLMCVFNPHSQRTSRHSREARAIVLGTQPDASRFRLILLGFGVSQKHKLGRNGDSRLVVSGSHGRLRRDTVQVDRQQWSARATWRGLGRRNPSLQRNDSTTPQHHNYRRCMV